jgi:hypothetical protein
MPSTLQTLTASGNSSLIPDHTISPPRLLEWADAESEAAEQYLRAIALASAELPEAIRHHMQQRAVDNLKDSPLALGTAGFVAWAISARAVTFLLWLSLRIRHPGVTRHQCAQWLAGPNGQRIAQAVWDLWGYGIEKKVFGWREEAKSGRLSTASSEPSELNLNRSAD